MNSIEKTVRELKRIKPWKYMIVVSIATVMLICHTCIIFYITIPNMVSQITKLVILEKRILVIEKQTEQNLDRVQTLSTDLGPTIKNALQYTYYPVFFWYACAIGSFLGMIPLSRRIQRAAKHIEENVDSETS